MRRIQIKLMIGSSLAGRRDSTRHVLGRGVSRLRAGPAHDGGPKALTSRTPSTAYPGRLRGRLRPARCHTARRLPYDAAAAPKARSRARPAVVPVGTEA